MGHLPSLEDLPMSICTLDSRDRVCGPRDEVVLFSSGTRIICANDMRTLSHDPQKPLDHFSRGATSHATSCPFLMGRHAFLEETHTRSAQPSGTLVTGNRKGHGMLFCSGSLPCNRVSANGRKALPCLT